MPRRQWNLPAHLASKWNSFIGYLRPWRCRLNPLLSTHAVRPHTHGGVCFSLKAAVATEPRSEHTAGESWMHYRRFKRVFGPSPVSAWSPASSQSLPWSSCCHFPMCVFLSVLIIVSFSVCAFMWVCACVWLCVYLHGSWRKTRVVTYKKWSIRNNLYFFVNCPCTLTKSALNLQKKVSKGTSSKGVSWSMITSQTST